MKAMMFGWAENGEPAGEARSAERADDGMGLRCDAIPCTPGAAPLLLSAAIHRLPNNLMAAVSSGTPNNRTIPAIALHLPL